MPSQQGKGREDSHLREQYVIFRKDEWALRGTDGRRTVVTKFVWLWCPLLVSAPVMSPSSLVGETAGEGIYDDGVPFGGPVFRQMLGVQRQPFPALLLLSAYSSK